MLRTRILVSLISLPVLIGVILAGGALYFVAAVGILGVGAWELHRLMRGGGYAPSLLVGWLVLLVIVLAEVRPDVLGPGLTLALLLNMATTLRGFHDGAKTPFNNYALGAMTGLYPGWLGAGLIAIRLRPDGAAWILAVLAIVFAADTGAYAIGRTFGRHKLAPWVSPSKTWEGYLGGLGSAVLIGAIAMLAGQPVAPAMQLHHGLLLGLLIGLLAPLGDLATSSFKRQVGAKDASHLIPGHGGFMDRLDSVLVALALARYYLLWFV